MNNYSNMVKKKLDTAISDLCSISYLFSKSPSKDFTRNRRLTLKKLIEFIVSMGGNSISKELLEYYDYDEDVVTASAFIQQREKLLPEAFAFLLNQFTGMLDGMKTFEGYRVLAVDGSSLNVPLNPNNLESYIQRSSSPKGYNLYHLNALYDVINKIYLDCVIQGDNEKNEFRAATNIVDRNEFTLPTIITFDRGYNSYNLMAHINKKGVYYLIRTHSPDKKGILSNLGLPVDTIFDQPCTVRLSRRATTSVKLIENYRYLSKTSTFDYVPPGSDIIYEINFRAVCVEIEDGNYQHFLTNLPIEDISFSQIKRLYHMRWGIEIGFREIKYTMGLLHFHSRKPQNILQEIYATLIMYNFCEAITNHIVITQKRKLEYKVNYTMAIHICKKFFRSSGFGRPPNVKKLIQKYILPIRSDRKYPRKVKFRSCVSFIYRVA